jgi:ferric-dicitrate binding protein FerR (iron transport regulator)
MTEKTNNQNSDSERFKNQDLEQKILKHAASLKVPPGLSTEEALSKVKSRISSGNTAFQVKRNMRKTLFMYSSVAATILLLFGIWRIWIYRPVTEVNVAKADHTEYNLPDGSQVKINSDSKISFNKKDFMKNRRLNLDGEAYFEITKGDNFIITTKHADIKILGTTFNVFSRGEEFKVSCLTGKIQVSDKNTFVIIIPGETATIKDNSLIYFQDKNINSANSWTAGEFYFENAPLNLIFSEMERQFNVKFELQNVGEKYFSGSFSNINLDTALETICQPMGLKYEIGGKDKIFISEKKP